MKQFLRYLLVQLVAYFLDIGGFILLFSQANFEPILANAVSKIVAGIFAFIAHRKFTFQVADSASNVQQWLRYFVLLTLNIPLSTLVLGIALWVVPATVLAKFIGDAVCVAITYTLSKRLVFIGHNPV